jgi:hypothetical protein
MTPVETFQALLKVNKNSAQILLGGMAIFATASFIAAWKIDISTAAIVGLIVVALGIILLFLSFVVGDGILKRIIAWAMTIFIFLILLTFFVSAVSAGQTFIKPIECLVRFWEKCEKASDAVAERNAPQVDIRQPAAEPDGVSPADRAKYKVWIQFAGYKREDMVQLAETLAEVGWNVPNPEDGGERLPSADGKAEVRYRGDVERHAAEQLAADISESGVKSGVKARQMPIVGPNVLEVWIGL